MKNLCQQTETPKHSTCTNVFTTSTIECFSTLIKTCQRGKLADKTAQGRNEEENVDGQVKEDKEEQATKN